jgi:multiple sugar transport system permease protein
MSNNEKPSGWGNISSGYFLKQAVWDTVYKFFRVILLFGLCFLILQPLLDKLSVSFMDEQDLYDGTVTSVPRHFTFGNYRLAGALLNYWPSLFQSLFIMTVSAALQVSACALAGYGFARFKFPLKNFWFICVILTIIIPPQTIIASLYLNFRFFDILGIIRLIKGKPVDMLNSFAGYWLLSATGMGLKSGLYIFMLREYFRGVPKELEEAAWVDGCGKLKTFIRIMLPDAAPMLTSCFLFSFVWQWTDAQYAPLFLRANKILSNGLSGLTDRITQWWWSNVQAEPPLAVIQMLTATGTLMFIAPLALLYLVAQRSFVESLSQTGIKM